jgi:hypothetical protein
MDVLCVRVELSEAERAAGALLHSPPFSAPSSFTQIGFLYGKTHFLEVVNFFNLTGLSHEMDLAFQAFEDMHGQSSHVYFSGIELSLGSGGFVTFNFLGP